MVETSNSLEKAEVAAALVECPEYCYVSIPANLSMVFIHLLIVNDETGLWGSCDQIKSLESCLNCLVLAILLNISQCIYLDNVITLFVYYVVNYFSKMRSQNKINVLQPTFV